MSGRYLSRRRWYPYPAEGGPDPELRIASPVGTAAREGFVWLPRPGPRVPDCRYWVYANDGLGGPVDLDRPVAGPLDDPGWVSASLAFPGVYRFVVRSFDFCGRCEFGLDSHVQLELDGLGNAVSVS